MSTFNGILLEIHEKISVRDEDRKPYTEMYDSIRMWLITQMRAIDPLFDQMYKGTELFGSYANNVRIIKPSEYDVSILLKLPYPLILCTNPIYPGFARISRDQRYGNEQDSEIFTRNSLDRLKIGNWISRIMTHVVNKLTPPSSYSIKYTCCNVAHNIYVREICPPYKIISIDFVPSIVVHKDSIIPVLELSEEDKQQCYLESFLAIPQCVTGVRNRYNRKMNMFRFVNPKAERDIIWDKKNLKDVYRLLKSIRDKHNFQRFKSYFFTAAFLLEVKKQPAKFWEKPVEEIFFQMLEVLIVYFRSQHLPFYWDHDYNLLSILKERQKINTLNILIEVKEELLRISRRERVLYDDLQPYFKTRQ